MRSPRWMMVLGMAVSLSPRPSLPLQSQQPVQPVAPAAPDAPVKPSLPPPANAPKPGTPKHSHANDFLISGTVFTEKALSFPEVQVRIRRSGEKKFRWETSTNSRGDYAVRVPQGTKYELVARVKGYSEQTRTVETKIGDDQERIVFRMEPLAGGKK